MSDVPVILLAIANDVELTTVALKSLAEERRNIENAIDQASRDGLCEYCLLPNATLDDVVNKFYDPHYRGRIAVFHFAGHADYYTLHFETALRNKQRINAKSFASFLGRQPGLHLVFLNACVTMEQAQFLIDQDVPAVIATEKKVNDEVARDMATAYYRGLGGGGEIEVAFSNAVDLLESKKSNRTRGVGLGEDIKLLCDTSWRLDLLPGLNAGQWNLPMLAEQPLYKLPLPRHYELPTFPFPGNRPYRQMEAYAFWGRDKEIRQLYDRLYEDSRQQVLLMYGVSQVGKTSLLQAGFIPRVEDYFRIEYWCFEDLTQEIKLVETIDQKASMLIDRRDLIIIDNLSILCAAVITKIKQLSGSAKIVLSTRLSHRKSWEEGLVENSINYGLLYIPPISSEGIVQIFKRLSIHYRVKLEQEIVKRVAPLLTKDPTSSVTPVLQIGLSHLWKKATSDNRSQPVFDWNLCNELFRESFWREFLVIQMRAVNLHSYESGLLLNLLNDCISEEYSLTQSVNKKDVLKNYAHRGVEVTKFIEEMINRAVLCEPASNTAVAVGQIRLTHQLLINALQTLLKQSNLPGQQVIRMLHHYQQQRQLSLPSVMKIAQHQFIMTHLPLISTSISVSFEESLVAEGRRLRKLERQRRTQQGLRILGIILILLFGHEISSPPFLLFLTLVIVLFRPRPFSWDDI